MRTHIAYSTPRLVLALLGAGALPAVARAQAAPAASSGITVLEKFIASETRMEDSTTLMPNSRPVDSLYGFARSLLDTPRSVSVLTPETLSQRGIDDVYDLASLVPGATVTNYYGVPGIPTTRGLFTGIYFNGMQRVWNRNGYPTSFGSLESMDYVRGPAPGHYSAASPGGFVNFLPKSPYFDKNRGSIKTTYASYDKLTVQADVGGPFLFGNKPAAFRVSVTNQAADSYYAGIKDDYFSAYGSLKMRLTDTVSIYAGGEFYRHRSKENPGWNRVTQDLIDNDNYIYGSPVNDLTAPSLTVRLPSGRTFTFANTTPGFVNRAALETATPFGGTRGDFNGSFFALAGGFSDSGFRPARVAANPDAQYFYSFLGAIDNPTARTVKLDGSQVLTDAQDFTDADTFLAFFDTAFTPRAGLKITNKFFVDAYKREKVSSYGYGEFGENLTIENKVLVEQSFRVLGGINVSYGASVRYEDSIAKTEFTVEPFNRRDISKAPTLNDTLKSGAQRDTRGKTFWDPFGSVYSELLTAGVFLTPEIKFSDAFSVILSGRWDNASWDRGVPNGLGADFNSGPQPSGGTSYTNYSVSPVFKVTPHVTVYGTAQRGTSLQGFYVSGSINAGDTNYQESSLGEVGVKVTGLDNKVFVATNYFYQELVNFDVRGGQAVPQRGHGIEIEGGAELSKAFSLNANVAWQEHFYRTPTIPGGFVALTTQQLVQYAGIFSADFGGRPNPGGPRFGVPEWTGSLFARYSFGNGWGISGGPVYTQSQWGNPEKTLRLPSHTLWNATIYYVTPKWEIALAGQNLTDERYFHPYDSFAGNAIILKGTPVTAALTFKVKF
jgi:iron complex outermembrane receptor protein